MAAAKGALRAATKPDSEDIRDISITPIQAAA
jgi:hypothetical protein